MDERLEIISGTVKRVIYNNAYTGFSVIELEKDGFTETVAGNIPDVSIGEEVEITGKYVVHATYGQQFKAESCLKTLPSGTAAILRYLSSGTIKGIGPATAKKIVQQFGDKTFDVMENNPEKISTIKGISLVRAKEIQAEISSKRSLRELCIRLAQYGLSADEVVTAFNVLGETVVEQIEGNPYLLCKEEIGFDFERADEIARKLGILEDNVERICAGVMFVIRHNLLNGHTCLPKGKVLDIATKLLGCNSWQTDDACVVLNERKSVTEFIKDGIPFLALSQQYNCEAYISNRLKTELSLNAKEKTVSDKDINQAEKELNIKFDKMQTEAIALSVISSIFILTGGPGTGKTTTVNGIIRVFENRGMKIALAAPTGRAAKRMSELCSREAKTIHRLLEVGTSEDRKKHIFVRCEKNPLDVDAVIIDEMSMVDAFLFEALLKALRLGTRLVLVGDSDQLPSVGAGNVFKDLIDSKKFQTVRLSKIFRQAMDSMIVVNSHRIINNEQLELDRKDTDFFMLESRTSEQATRLVADLCCRRLPEAFGMSAFNGIQVLCPSKKMELGTVNLNNILQQQLNPPTENTPEIEFKGFVLRKNDKVMQTKNNYDIVWEDDEGKVGTGVFNGDVGILENIDVKNRCVTVRFPSCVAEYSGDEVMQLELAYAVTVHKSQGSEFDCVVLPLLDFPYQLKYRNLLYTAVTRAKKMLIVVGSREELYKMVQNDRKNLRYSALQQLLKEEQ